MRQGKSDGQVSADITAAYINALLRRRHRTRDPFYSAQKLADDLGVPKWRIPSMLKQTCGENFNTVVNRVRVEDAKTLLEDIGQAGTTIDDVGFMSGFANRQSFYTAFRRETGTTPSKYREKVTNEKR